MLVLRVPWVLTVLRDRLISIGKRVFPGSDGADGPRYPAFHGLAILLKVVGSSLWPKELSKLSIVCGLNLCCLLLSAGLLVSAQDLQEPPTKARSFRSSKRRSGSSS